MVEGVGMPVNNRDIAVRFFPIFIPIAVLTLVVVYLFFSFNQRVAKDIIERDELHNIERLKTVSTVDLRSVIADLLMLLDYNNHLEKSSGLHSAATAELVGEYTSFISRKRVYDQIRYLNNDGMEVVRVNFDGEKSSVSSAKALQSKKSMYYFRDTIRLKRGEIFVSQIDLNLENGKIEEPVKPVMRLGTPVFNSNGDKTGIVLLNYLGGEFLGKLKGHHGSNLSNLLVLNREGHYLVATTSDDEWGFMYEDKVDKTFQSTYPEVWEKILQQKDGQLYAKDGLFTFGTVYPVLDALGWRDAGSVKNRRYFLRIVSFIPVNPLTGRMDAGSYVQAAALILLGFVVLSWYLARARARRFRAEDKLAAFIKE